MVDDEYDIDDYSDDDNLMDQGSDSEEREVEEFKNFKSYVEEKDDSLNQIPVLDYGREKVISSVQELNIGWNNFSDLKLILYSINFGGESEISVEQLKKRMFKILEPIYAVLFNSLDSYLLTDRNP